MLSTTTVEYETEMKAIKKGWEVSNLDSWTEKTLKTPLETFVIMSHPTLATPTPYCQKIVYLTVWTVLL